jgi:hypothetical protein
MMLSDTMNYSRNLIPTSKVDLERAKAAIEAGYPAVEPILGIWRDAGAGRKLSAFPFHQPQSQDRDTEFNDFFLTADKSFGKILTYFGESV